MRLSHRARAVSLQWALTGQKSDEQIKLGNQTMTVLADQEKIEGVRLDICIGAIDGTLRFFCHGIAGRPGGTDQRKH